MHCTLLDSHGNVSGFPGIGLLRPVRYIRRHYEYYSLLNVVVRRKIFNVIE